MKAAMYKRVSTREQDDNGYGLPIQEDECRRKAEQLQWDIVEVFSDDCSGDLRDRPKFSELRRLVEKRSIEAVIVHRIDRLARKAWISLEFVELCKSNNVLVYVANLGFVDDPLVAAVYAGAGQKDKEGILDRMKQGKKRHILNNNALGAGSAPFGYRYEKIGKKVQYVIDERDSPTVELIFHLAVYEGLRTSQIADRLTELGKLSWSDRRGMRKEKPKGLGKIRPVGTWSKSSVYDILTNPLYKGKMAYNRRDEVTDPETGKLIRRTRPYDDPAIIWVDVPAIIEASLFDAAQQTIVKGRNWDKEQGKHPYLLSRRIKCRCGYGVYGKRLQNLMPNGERYAYYECNGASTRNTVYKCKLPMYRADKVDNVVWEWVYTTLLDPETLEDGLRELQSTTEDQRAELLDRREKQLEQLEQINAKLVRIKQLHIDGIYSQAELRADKARHEQAREIIQEGITALDEQLATLGISDDEITLLKQFATRLRKGLDIANFEQKRKVLQMLNVQAELYMREGEKIVKVSCSLPNTQEELSLSVTSTASRSCRLDSPALPGHCCRSVGRC